MNRFIQYIRDTRAELVHVKWPSRNQAVAFTLIVIGVSILTSLVLGFFDYVLSLVIQKFVL
ncbi:preprotein translocase subunit SecE [Candidatus Parcubacteria bacterium]|nr:preprotein translocase subunit SecE [Candidatus Parcubacteria bacterium]